MYKQILVERKEIFCLFFKLEILIWLMILATTRIGKLFHVMWESCLITIAQGAQKIVEKQQIHKWYYRYTILMKIRQIIRSKILLHFVPAVILK